MWWRAAFFNFGRETLGVTSDPRPPSNRQADPRAQAAHRAVFQINITTMRAGNIARDGQPQSCAARRQAGEGLEDFLSGGGGNAWAIIINANIRPVFGFPAWMA